MNKRNSTDGENFDAKWNEEKPNSAWMIARDRDKQSEMKWMAKTLTIIEFCSINVGIALIFLWFNLVISKNLSFSLVLTAYFNAILSVDFTSFCLFCSVRCEWANLPTAADSKLLLAIESRLYPCAFVFIIGEIRVRFGYAKCNWGSIININIKINVQVSFMGIDVDSLPLPLPINDKIWMVCHQSLTSRYKIKERTGNQKPTPNHHNNVSIKSGAAQ